jgi:hypothetical protein
MNNLLESAVTAHGGLDRWNQVKSITVDASITGAVWHVKNQGDALKDIRFEVDTTRQLLIINFVGQDKRSVFEPHRVEIQHSDSLLCQGRTAICGFLAGCWSARGAAGGWERPQNRGCCRSRSDRGGPSSA